MRRARFATKARRTHLWLEELETRQLLSGYQPSAIEQLFLEQLNDARANPAAYGASIGLDLSGVAPSQPLAFNTQLVQAARLHSQDMNDHGYFAHNTLQGINPGQRMSAAGFVWNSWGESIAGGSSFPGPAEALRALIIDAGIADLGHRRHLLAIDSLFKEQNQVGIGVVQSGSGPLTNYYTIDSASSPGVGPFVTGAVINDSNANGKYDYGEGLANVTITVAGVGPTVTYPSGGFSIAVSPGTYTVTATGGGLTAPVVRTVSVGTTNYRLTITNDASGGYVRRLYQTILGRTPSDLEVTLWMPIIQSSGGANTVASAIEHSAEARTRLVKSWYTTYLGRTANNGEEQGWVTLLTQGAREESVLSVILNSQEFYIHAGTLSLTGNADERFVQSLYSLLLNRTASSLEVGAWVAALPSFGRGTVALAFLRSGEYRTDTVIGCYMGLLHRQSPPSSTEVGFWVNSGFDCTAMRVRFEASYEFMVNG